MIASTSSSLPELAGDGAALLVEPEDTAGLAAAIMCVVNDAPLRKRLITQEFENVKRFSWNGATEHVLDTLLRAAVI